MSALPRAFEIALTAGPTAHQFTVFVPDGDGSRAAEHTFSWRTDSTALALDLGVAAMLWAVGVYLSG